MKLIIIKKLDKFRLLHAVNITAKITINVLQFLLIHAIYHLIIFIILYRAVYYTVNVFYQHTD